MPFEWLSTRECGASFTPTNLPYPPSSPFRPKQLPESRWSSELLALTPSQPPHPHPAADRGTPPSEVRDRYPFQTITCVTQLKSAPFPTKPFSPGKAASKPLLCSCWGTRVGGSQLQESKVCQIPGGLVACRQTMPGSPPRVRGCLTPMAHLPPLQCASQLLSPLEKFLHQKRKDQVFLHPGR